MKKEKGQLRRSLLEREEEISKLKSEKQENEKKNEKDFKKNPSRI